MGGLIDPRIVNRPPAQPSPLHSTCPAEYKTCCYAPDLDLSVFQRNHQCIPPLAQQSATQHSAQCLLEPGLPGDSSVREQAVWHQELPWSSTRSQSWSEFTRRVPLDLHPPQPEQ